MSVEVVDGIIEDLLHFLWIHCKFNESYRSVLCNMDA